MSAELFGMGILIDVVDEEWMRDTLPDDGILFVLLPHISLLLSLLLFPFPYDLSSMNACFFASQSFFISFFFFLLLVFFIDLLLPPVMVVRSEETEDSSKSFYLIFSVSSFIE